MSINLLHFVKSQYQYLFIKFPFLLQIEVGPNNTKGKNGDYQCSCSFLIAKEMGKLGQKSNPKEVSLALRRLVSPTSMIGHW